VGDRKLIKRKLTIRYEYSHFCPDTPNRHDGTRASGHGSTLQLHRFGSSLGARRRSIRPGSSARPTAVAANA
jgi:hypothetical protein